MNKYDIMLPYIGIGGVFFVRANFKVLRMAYGFTQSDVAKAIGTSTPTYLRKEKGANEFTESEIRALLTLFEKTYDELFIFGNGTERNHEIAV